MFVVKKVQVLIVQSCQVQKLGKETGYGSLFELTLVRKMGILFLLWLCTNAVSPSLIVHALN